jgi:hypothetical protein
MYLGRGGHHMAPDAGTRVAQTRTPSAPRAGWLGGRSTGLGGSGERPIGAACPAQPVHGTAGLHPGPSDPFVGAPFADCLCRLALRRRTVSKRAWLSSSGPRTRPAER